MTFAFHTLNEKLPKLAVEFFILFSRIEYAMKQSGTYARGDEKGVEPDWTKLAKDLGVGFYSQVVTKNVAQLLISEPPRKQILQSDGSLGWRDVDQIANVEDLFLAIRRARNNLFHGGKYLDERDGSYSEIRGTERNDTLLNEALMVLKLVLQAKPDIHKHIN